MGYTKEELKYLFLKEPEIRPVFPNIEIIIIMFLKKYNVSVMPCYDYGDFNQTDVQEWIKWKQWALGHKLFETYKESALKKHRLFNREVIEILNDPKNIRKFDAWLKSWRSEKGNNSKKKRPFDQYLESFVDVHERKEETFYILEEESFDKWYEKYEKRCLKKYRVLSPPLTTSILGRSKTKIDSQKRSETKIEQYLFEKALSQLDHEEQKILTMWYSLDGEEPLTLGEIGQQVNMSEEIVSEIIEEAIAKLRDIVHQH